jgi:serine O-acetyltransferase
MIIDKKIYKEYRIADDLANSRPKQNLYYMIYQFIFPDFIWRFLRLLRKTEYYKNCKKGWCGKLLYIYYLKKYKKISLKLGFSIPLNVFGPGLSLPHYGTIVVNPATRVGKNCRLHACVNIGASGGGAHSPIIGDNVYIGPGAILFGNIKISDNVTIAANSTVNKSIEITNITVGGTPAKIINENTPVWWIRNRLDLDF